MRSMTASRPSSRITAGRRPPTCGPSWRRCSAAGRRSRGRFGFIHKGHYIAHVGSFDPAYASCAPGTLQIDDTIKACFEEGIHTYDLLAPADDCKRALGTASIPVRDWVLPRTARGMLYCRVAEGLVPRLKRLRDRFDGIAKRWQRIRATAG
jgi:CelD/BcsL family acetyltransferase involved in cellulose biosynthesis